MSFSTAAFSSRSFEWGGPLGFVCVVLVPAPIEAFSCTSDSTSFTLPFKLVRAGFFALSVAAEACPCLGLTDPTALRRGGLSTGVFSWALCALLAVGLVSLAKNPSSALLAMLTRDLGLSWSPLVRDAVEAFLAKEEAVVDVAALEVIGFAVGDFLGVLLFVSDSAFCAVPSALATDAAVVAVAADGSLIGWVGDFGVSILGIFISFEIFSFLTPVVVGFEISSLLFLALADSVLLLVAA